MDPAYVGGEIGQGHLLEGVRGDAEKQEALLQQLADLDAAYPGGLLKYVENARTLLKASAEGLNPFEGYVPAVPEGERLQAATPQFEEMEALGMEHMDKVAFVLVAGGLGERLGYHGIKIEMPGELVTGKSFLQNYIESILALQMRCRVAKNDPYIDIDLAIMTSDDTHEQTLELLHKHTNFGMSHEQIALLKQEKVPALKDNQGRFAQDPETGLVITKPHGHGDVHSLLHLSGVLDAWVSSGVERIVFFQDTNGLVFRSIVPAVGVSVANGFDVNSLTVPRKPGEAVGGICKLQGEKGALTINVEYNQLDPLLRATSSPGGDVAGEDGFSPYPGNINVLVFDAKKYKATLDRTGGSIPEFVNPKYSDNTKTTFKAPTRLECMMQDYPKLLVGDSDAKVGFTQMERFISFSAVKNNPEEARNKLKATGFPESASSGESDLYASNRMILSMAGVQVNTANIPSTTWLGIPIPDGARVVLAPNFGTTLSEIRSRFPTPDKVSISDRSSLVLDGDIYVESLTLDGDLRITAAQGARIVIRNLKVVNQGIKLVPAEQVDGEVYQMRGYRKKEIESLIIAQMEPGETVIDRP